jgi:hypothetical protein
MKQGFDLFRLLEAIGAAPAISNKQIVLPCPFSDHDGEKMNIWIDMESGAGMCAKCGEKSFDDLISTLMVIKDHKKESGVLDRGLRNKFKIIPWNEFESFSFPENAWRVNGLIPLDGVTIIAAPSGEKKSWLCMALARSVAEGNVFLGNPDLSVEKCKVLYIENESPKSEIQRRGRMLGFGDGILIHEQDCPSLNDDANVNELLKICVDQGVGLLFVDTIRSIAGGLQEDKAELVRGFFDRFKKFSEFGITVVMTDHLRKPNRFESKSVPKKDQLLGSQDKTAAANALISIRSEAGSDEISVYPLKLKAGKELPPFIAQMKEEGGQISFVHGGEIQQQMLKVERAKEVIKEFLANVSEPQDTQHIIEGVKDAGVGKSNVETALKQMREGKEIGFKKEGKKWVYSLLLPDESPEVEDEKVQLPDLFDAPIAQPDPHEPEQL